MRMGTQWIALYVKSDHGTYIDSFEVGHVPEIIKKFRGNNYL